MTTFVVMYHSNVSVKYSFTTEIEVISFISEFVGKVCIMTGFLI